MKDDNIVGWFTTESGQHMPLREGETKKEATQKFLNKKMSRVEKNKEKYDKINEFTKKKKSNNQIDKKDEKNQTKNNDDKKNIRLEKAGNQYIPVREGEDIDSNNIYEKNINKEREDFYETYANFYQEEKRTNGRTYYAKLTSGELNQELEEKLDKKLETVGKITKEDVKSVIEDFKKRKASNVKQMPEFKGTDTEKLKQERDYIDEQIRDLESGNVFVVRDNPSNQDNYLLRRKNYMSIKDRLKYEKLEQRREEIDKLLRK